MPYLWSQLGGRKNPWSFWNVLVWMNSTWDSRGIFFENRFGTFGFSFKQYPPWIVGEIPSCIGARGSNKLLWEVLLINYGVVKSNEYNPTLLGRERKKLGHFDLTSQGTWWSSQIGVRLFFFGGIQAAHPIFQNSTTDCILIKPPKMFDIVYFFTTFDGCDVEMFDIDM